MKGVSLLKTLNHVGRMVVQIVNND